MEKNQSLEWALRDAQNQVRRAERDLRNKTAKLNALTEAINNEIARTIRTDQRRLFDDSPDPDSK
jgi:hypothetical protein